MKTEVNVSKTAEQLSQEYFSVGFVGKHCGVSNTTVLRWVVAGQLPAFRLPGGHYRVGREDLAAFLKKYHMPDSVAIPANNITPE
jgi:excisionase family DNA binding protein